MGNPGGDGLEASSSTAVPLFSYIPQGNTLFTGTIADNLRMVRPEATDDEIVRALKAACAWDFVEQLEEGIHTQVRERGRRFSEGQKQRLSIARALLADAPILILGRSHQRPGRGDGAAGAAQHYQSGTTPDADRGGAPPQRIFHVQPGVYKIQGPYGQGGG